jgi:NAD(P)-dependent dehydrogenase (short-subunit alcohol dehydrogenase family)
MSSVFLITGSTGIAEATARLAVSRGHRVFVVSNDEHAAVDLCLQLHDCECYIGDLREETNAHAALTACQEVYGRVDGLFNVAGVSGRRYGDGPVHDCTVDGWSTTIEHNARTMFLMSREVLRLWLAMGQRGVILNMASVLATSPEPEYFATHAYAASKGAVIALTNAMAAFYAPHGIRVNAIAPGLVATPMSERAQSDPRILEFIARKQPLSEGMLNADEIASASLFLLSEESRHITGQVLAVDGGWKVS